MSIFIPLMAADSKMFVRGIEPHTFKGCMGVCLSFPSPDTFKDNYWEFISKISCKVGIPGDRKILKSYDLRQVYGDDDIGFLNCLNDFIVFLSKEGVIINTVFTTLNTKAMPNVIKYGYGKYPSEEVSSISFLDTLSSYYPYIAAWKVSKSAHLKGVAVYLDSLTGDYTHAWNELCAHHNVQIIPKGDMCNPFISSADLALRFVDESLSQKRLHLNEESIARCFEDCKITDMHTYYVGHPELESIVPLEKRKINFNEYYARPMLYIFKESNLGADFIEKSKLWTKLLNFAYDKGAGLKFMDLNEDHKYIKDGDYLIHIGNEGKIFGENLINIGYEVNLLSSQQLLRQ